MTSLVLASYLLLEVTHKITECCKQELTSFVILLIPNFLAGSFPIKATFFWKVYTSLSSNLFKIGSLTLFSDLKKSWKFKLSIFTTSKVMSIWNFTCFCQSSLFVSWQFRWNFTRNNWITWEPLNIFSWNFQCVHYIGLFKYQ